MTDSELLQAVFAILENPSIPDMMKIELALGIKPNGLNAFQENGPGWTHVQENDFSEFPDFS